MRKPAINSVIAIFYVYLLILFFAIGCSHNVKPSAERPPTPKPVQIKKESVIGHSVEGRPIKSIILTLPQSVGDSPDTAKQSHTEVVLMMAAMHGDEVIGTPLLHRLSQYLMEHKRLLVNRKVVLLPEVNPDAIEKQTRRNANNIDLNRDFLSEVPQPETQAVLDAINTHHPDRVISIRKLRFLDYDGADMAAAKTIAEHIQAYADGLPIHQIPTSNGSLGHFGETHDIPVITLGVRGSVSLDWGKVWDRFGNSIVAAVTFPDPVPESIRIVAKERPETPSDSQTRDSEETKTTGADDRSGSQSTPPVPEPGPAKNEHFERGKRLYEKGDYGSALKAFESAKRAGECAACGEYVQKARTAEADLNKGIARYNDDDFQGAVTALMRVVDLNPDDATAAEYLAQSHLGMGLALFKEGAYAAARENFKVALRYSDGCSACQEYLSQTIEVENALKSGIASFEQGAYEDAVDALAAVIRINAEEKRAAEYLYRSHRRLGAAYWETGAIKDAQYHFDNALRYNPACAECRDRLKALHYELGRRHFVEAGGKAGREAVAALESAIREWRAVAAIDPDYENVAEKIEKAEQHKSRLQNEASE